MVKATSGMVLMVEVCDDVTQGFPPIVNTLSSATLDIPLTLIESVSP